MMKNNDGRDRVGGGSGSTLGADGSTRRKFLLASGAVGSAFLAGCNGDLEDGDLTVENMEVTQAVQYLDNPSEADNSLPLVRGKRAFVRVYVGVSGTTGSVTGVDGQLRVWVDGTELSGSPFSAENGPITAPTSPDRAETDDTLNFQFLVPETGTATGAVDVDFEAAVNHDGSIPETETGNNAMTLSDVTFECNRSPSIAYVPIDYTYEDAPAGGSGLPDASMIRPGVGDDFIWHSYPIPEPPNYYEASIPPVEWDEDVGDTYGDLLDDLETTRTMLTPEPDFIYGWLPGNPFWGNGAADGTSDAAFGNTEDVRYQRTFAHEIGHLLGMGHNTRTVSPEVGFYSSYPVHNIRTDACDSTGDQRTKCGTLKDFMDAGEVTEDAWIDPETYSYLANHSTIADHDCPALPFVELPRLEYYFVTGTVARTAEVGTHSLNRIYRLEGETKLAEDDPDGTRRIEFRNEDGEVLLERTFEVSFHGTDSEKPLEEAPFSLALPAANARAATSVVLFSEDEAVSRIQRSPNPPELEIQSPRPGQVLGGQQEKVPVEWEARDPDGDDLHFSVQYSPDQGERFVPLKVNITETGFSVNPAEIPGSREQAGLLRVVATDGFNTTVEQVAGLTVPRKPPTVRITEPKVHEDQPEQERVLEIPAGRSLVLSGHGYDPEDGFLADEAMRWSSSEDGDLGAGRTIQVSDLSAGKHRITLAGFDSDQNEVEDSIIVSVGE